MNDEIKRFESACNAIVNGGVLMGEQKIVLLLNEITRNNLVYSIIEKCMEGYDYYSNKSSVFTLTGGQIGGKFCPPKERKEFIAMSFSFLYEIYVGKITLMETLDIYFSGRNYKEKFIDFCDRLIMVFDSLILSVYDDMQRIAQKKEVKVKTMSTGVESRFDTNKKVLFLEEQKNRLFSMKIKEYDKKYSIYFINKMIDEIKDKNSPELAYIGLKVLFKESKKYAKFLLDIKNVLGITDEL